MFRRNVELENQTHNKYTDFKLKQWLIDISQGKKLKVSLLDEDDNVLESEILHVGQYINCHANITIQDKGEKTL